MRQHEVRDTPGTPQGLLLCCLGVSIGQTCQVFLKGSQNFKAFSGSGFSAVNEKLRKLALRTACAAAAGGAAPCLPQSFN